MLDDPGVYYQNWVKNLNQTTNHRKSESRIWDPTDPNNLPIGQAGPSEVSISTPFDLLIFWEWRFFETGSGRYLPAQIIIFHHPRFPWNSRGFPYFSPPFGENRSCEVAIIWPDLSLKTLPLIIPSPSMKRNFITRQGKGKTLGTQQKTGNLNHHLVGGFNPSEKY